MKSQIDTLNDNTVYPANPAHKIDWEPAVLRRYTHPLSSETAEFPDAEHIAARLTPICYEESLPNGSSAPCAEFILVALEQYIKDVMGSILVRTRSNVGHVNLSGIRTAPSSTTNTYPTAKKSKRKREAASTVAEKEKERIADMERWARRPLNMGDLKFALQRGDVGFAASKAVVGRVMSGWEEGVLEGWNTYDTSDEEAEGESWGNGPAGGLLTNGVYPEEPDDGWGWEGGGKAERMQLHSLLDECLAFGQ